MKDHKNHLSNNNSPSYHNSDVADLYIRSMLKSAELEFDSELYCKKGENSIPATSVISEPLLHLTNIQSFLQIDKDELYSRIQETKRKMRNKPFQVRSTPSSFCKKNRIAIINPNNNTVKYSRIGCGSLTCPDCGPNKAIQRQILIKETAVLNNLNYFLTLTLDPKKIPREYFNEKNNNTYEYITYLFNRFNIYIRRKYLKERSKDYKYIWVVEYQKNGLAHLHILTNLWLDIKIVTQIWIGIGGGEISWITQAKSISRLSSYVGKYISKGMSNFNNFKFFKKRYSISRSCKRPEKNIKPLLSNDVKLSAMDKLILLKGTKYENILYNLYKEEFKEETTNIE